ncbi:MAG: hypothetical protein LV479_00775 [Methylacidiphilales bacterium]|nr:hypothetical protein [Candidatus Methylacidiphilales bacterium]
MPENRGAKIVPASIWFIVIALLALTGEPRLWAEGDVTIVAPPSDSTQAAQKPVASDGAPVVHKSSHRKKHPVASTNNANGSATALASGNSSSASNTSPASSGMASQSKTTATVSSVKKTVTKPMVPPAPVTSVVAAAAHYDTPPIAPDPPPVKTIVNYSTPGSALMETETSSSPTVETGVPLARYQSVEEGGGPIPASATFSKVKSTSRDEVISSDGYSTRISAPGSDDFVFTNYRRKPKNIYPWKTNIITTMFWIGEPGSNISPTDNMASSWDENWVSSNAGKDNPYDRNGYAPASHAPTLNPFYVALPFNDLAYPDKARRWLPAGWYRKPKDGKQVSACKDRWVQIKNAQGRSCYAQWEDVGPLVSDHAEYVFGDERPDTLTRAGLDVSPAVAQYLGIDGNNRYTSWRFIDDEEVPPGAWLKYDEQAVIFAALEQLKNSHSDSPMPIQRSAEPMDDPASVDTNKKKVGAAKG